jgi:cystathionine beta-lyase
MYLAVQAFSAPGDGVVIETPIYPPFFDSVRENGRRLLEHRLVASQRPGVRGYELDVESLRARADGRTRILLFCNPHNPTGRVFRRDELLAMAELARERDWIVVSDEIHQDLVFRGHEHVPFATLSEDAARRTVTLTSATKAFNIPGLRTAIAHFGSAGLQRRFGAVVPRHTRGGLGLLGLYATAAAWRHADPWLAEARAYLESNRDFALRVLAAELPEIRFQAAEATYLQWLDCRALELEPSPARFFYERARVALSDGAKFGEGFEGYARLNFATSRALLQQILEKLTKAVRSR